MSRRRTMLLVLGMMVTTLSGPDVSTAQTPVGDERGQFRFEFAQTKSYWGLGVEGWVYNDLPWPITNIRLRVDCLDASGTVTESVAGWVHGGELSAGGRGYFYARISSPAAMYRVRIQSFDKVAREAPPQAP